MLPSKRGTSIRLAGILCRPQSGPNWIYGRHTWMRGLKLSKQRTLSPPLLRARTVGLANRRLRVFTNGHHAIGFDVLQSLRGTARPIDIDSIHLLARTQTKMQSEIALRKVTAPA